MSANVDAPADPFCLKCGCNLAGDTVIGSCDHNSVTTGFHYWLAGKERLIVTDRASPFLGWLCYRHPNGGWVTLQKLDEETASAIAERQSGVRWGFSFAAPNEGDANG